ncbi:hypothetical protein BgiMline_025001 [Biomphalaria glabrata]|uniref:Uncharacterized protein LOC106060918 n=1 Tax=Biomphalaria glabrata TaxID=6526 RepID=A0A9W3BL56_BIOGL|nr:uncharacterized protein LOC106060918 [Biomphalaria glabrata]XP_055900154.1 uncharacterized protein LOC106060918 [Biomphalaria glabrata]KAI8761008.1 nucleolar protein dao-5 [Biomphalaria glabrata]
MGQNNSTAFHTSSNTLPRTTTTTSINTGIQTPAPPSSPPLDTNQKNNSYIVPENKVLPNSMGEVESARKLLRPVSQDLTKLHPDYAYVFPIDSNSKLNEVASIRRSTSMPGLNKENSSLSPTGQLSGEKRVNGHVRALSNATNGFHLSRSGEDLLSSSVDGDLENWNKLQRAQSMDRGMSTTSKPFRHSRQTSLASRNSLQDTVIFEDPREHLYNIARKEPFSDLVPTTTSLPVKSTFDMDYSYNLTYAQLTELRRQKRSQDIEERTGKKLEMLSADISASSNVPKSPFDLQNLGRKSSTHSVSTGSSETGVSKSKKKKAPAPPPPSMPPFRYTLSNEPPADYEMQNASAHLKPQRSNSSVSAKTKPPAPQPFPKRYSMTNMHEKKTPTTSQIPLPPSLSKLFTKPNIEPQNTKDKAQPPGFDLLQKTKEETQRQLETLKRLEESLKKVESVETPKEENNNNDPHSDTNESSFKTSSGLTNDSKASNVTIPSSGVPPPPPISNLESTSASSSNKSFKVMNSLLQHDIVLAAQARGAKILKPKTLAPPEKPKGPSEVFQEELAKVTQAREERWKLASTNSLSEVASEPSFTKLEDGDRVLLFESSQLSKSSPKKSTEKLYDTPAELDVKGVVKSEAQTKVSADLDGKNDEEELDEMKIAESVDMTKRHSIQSEAMSISSSNTSTRVLSPDWIPELDLDSDDDIMDEKITMSHKRVPSEGFKSSIIPTKLNDMKKSEQKKKTNSALNKTESLRDVTSHPAAEDKTKFGSVRKFKQGMRSAFGSISRASGKLFKKPKSKDKYKADSIADIFQQPEDVRLGEFLKDQNWALSGSRSNSLQRHIPSAAYSESEASSFSDADDIGDIDFANGIDQLPSPRLHSNDDENNKGLKRAGVAYVSKKGHIILLPEYNYGPTDETRDDSSEEEGRAPKIVRKKNKKFTYESTVRIQEKSRLELEVAKEIMEKEKQIEFERLRQQNMEREFLRLRDLDTQERIHRMQSATMKDQIDLIQHQRAAQYEINNNINGVTPQVYPTYISNGTVGVGNPAYINSFMPVVGSTVLPNTLPTNYPAHSSPLVGGGIINGVAGSPAVQQLTPQEMNRISEFMRRAGVAPPTTQQQWAVLLSTVSFNSPGFPTYDQKSSLYGMGSGPNLAHIFSGGKTIENMTTDSSRQVVSYGLGQKTFQNANIVSVDSNRRMVSAVDQLQPPPIDASAPQEVQLSSVSQSVDREANSSAHTSVDHHNHGTQEVQNHTGDNSVKSPTLSAKIYGPIGYKPVSFQNHVT